MSDRLTALLAFYAFLHALAIWLTPVDPAPLPAIAVVRPATKP